MARAFTPKVVTANDLIDGDVIYLTQNNTWSRDHAEAALFVDQDSADDRLAFATAQQNRLVGPYLADATAADAGADTGPTPNHFREEFRAVGPSNYFHGKQSEQENV